MDPCHTTMLLCAPLPWVSVSSHPRDGGLDPGSFSTLVSSLQEGTCPPWRHEMVQLVSFPVSLHPLIPLYPSTGLYYF